MADGDVDLNRYTAEQQTAIQQYSSVTNQSLAEAVPLLERCQWNVEIAITRFFDGEPATDPVAEAQASIPPPQDIRRQESLLNGIPATSSSRRPTHEPAPRVVPQPSSQVTQRGPLLVSLILAPFSLAYALLARTFGLLGYVFPFLPRLGAIFGLRSATSGFTGRRPLPPRDNAARFIREFEEEYGSHDIPFLETGYASAYDTAKKDLKFLLVILLSPEHDFTSSFVRDTLLSQQVRDFIRNPSNNVLVWAGNIRDSEAYQVSTELSCTKFPFSALIAHTPSVSSTAMSILTRIAGPTPPSQFVSKLQSAIQSNRAALDRTRAQRLEQQATRTLREEQNSAYERSLATDRERARRKREEEEARKRAEAEAQEREEREAKEASLKEQWIRWRASRLAPEPAAGGEGVVAVSLRMQDGERVVRRFSGDLEIEELYAFVECYPVLKDMEDNEKQDVEKPNDWENEYKFQLVSPFPREVYDLEKGGTVRQRIGRSGNLIVESTVGGDDDSEEE